MLRALLGLETSKDDDCFFFEPKEYDSSIIWLHGLGDSGRSFVSNLKLLFPRSKILCPNAPQSPVTLNDGMVMSSWLDIKSLESLDDEDKEDYSGMEESVQRIHRIIKREAQKVDSNRIILGGFSQGGAMAARAGLSCDMKLNSLVCCSAYKANWSTLKVRHTDTPVLICHGDADQVVAHSCGERLFEAVKSLEMSVEKKRYANMGHGMSFREWEDIKAFIESNLEPK